VRINVIAQTAPSSRDIRGTRWPGWRHPPHPHRGSCRRQRAGEGIRVRHSDTGSTRTRCTSRAASAHDEERVLRPIAANLAALASRGASCNTRDAVTAVRRWVLAGQAIGSTSLRRNCPARPRASGSRPGTCRRGELDRRILMPTAGAKIGGRHPLTEHDGRTLSHPDSVQKGRATAGTAAIVASMWARACVHRDGTRGTLSCSPTPARPKLSTPPDAAAEAAGEVLRTERSSRRRPDGRMAGHEQQGVPSKPLPSAATRGNRPRSRTTARPRGLVNRRQRHDPVRPYQELRKEFAPKVCTRSAPR